MDGVDVPRFIVVFESEQSMRISALPFCWVVPTSSDPLIQSQSRIPLAHLAGFHVDPKREGQKTYGILPLRD